MAGWISLNSCGKSDVWMDKCKFAIGFVCLEAGRRDAWMV